MNVGTPARRQSVDSSRELTPRLTRHLSQHLSRLQWLIIVAHLALALLYGALIPPWEAHDETGHDAFIDQLVTERALPTVRSDSTVFLDQSHQPPLYYLVTGALTAWVDRSHPLQPAINLFAFDGSNRHGARIVLRTAAEDFPWQGTVLALHAARVVSALLGTLMVFLIAHLAARIFPTSPAAAAFATALAAFNPQALFMAAMVNNDVMIGLIGAAVLLVAVTLMQDANETRLRYFVLLGALLGLALLSKRTSYGLLLFAALLLLGLAWRRKWSLGQLIVRAVAVAVPAVLISAPYFIRNLALYGTLIADRKIDNPLFTQPDAALLGAGTAVALRDGWVAQIFVNGFRTFWGTFGWGNVPLPEWAYFVFLAITVIGAVGFIFAVWRAAPTQRFVLIGLLICFISMGLPSVAQAVFFQNPQLFVGRYLMPALGAVAIGIAAGWHFWSQQWKRPINDAGEKHRQEVITVAPAFALAAFALLIPFVYLRPAYAAKMVSAASPTPLLIFQTAEQQPVAEVMSVDARFVYLQDREGQRPYAQVKLVWRAMQRTPANYAVGLSVLGYRNEVLGQTNQYPAGGNAPTTSWNPGEVFEDDYFIQIDKPCAVLPVQARINVALFEPPATMTSTTSSVPFTTTHTLKAVDADGRETLPAIGEFRVDAPAPVFKFWQPPLAVLGDVWLRQIDMPSSAKAGDTIQVTLAYEPAQSQLPEAKAFVHLLGPDGQPVAQQDQVPHETFYPTHQWVAGECVRETFNIALPANAAGTVHAVTGFYTADGTRFTTPDPADDDLAELGTIEIKP